MIRKLLPIRRVEGRPDQLSDEGLVAACALGDAAALGALFDRHQAPLRRYLSRLAGTDERDLDDLVQATFEAVPRAARGFDGRAQVRTWLLGIATNMVRHHVRSELRRKHLGESVAALPHADSADMSAELLERERGRRLRAAIASLTPKLREAFVLVYLEELPGADAAQVLGIREGALWKRLHEARGQLRHLLRGVMS